MTAAAKIVETLLENVDPNGQTFWHGARVGRQPGQAGADGLIFVSADRGYAETFVDPMERHMPEERQAHLVQAKVNVRNPKIFDIGNDDDFEAFTDRGISADSLKAEGFDSAILVDGNKIVDVAVVDPSQFSVLR